MIKLYYSPGACSLAAHIVLEELGIAFEPALVSLKDGDHHRADYLRVNPRARVPALVVDGKILTETPAILTYLAGGYSTRGLWPRETWKQAEVLSLMSWLSATVHITFATIMRPERYATDAAAKADVSATGKVNLAKQYAEIDKMLTDKNFFLGSQYTVCDPYLLVFYRWGNRIGMDMKTLYPNWTKHALRVSSRATVKRVFEVEGIVLEG